MYVCNNDCTVKVFELQPQQLRQAFLLRCSVAINYVSTSPTDPANTVAVGDSKDVYMYRMAREDMSCCCVVTAMVATAVCCCDT